MKVLKFGGTSLANAERMKNVAKIVLQSASDEQSVFVVLSAISGSTNALSDIVASLKQSKIEVAEKIITQLTLTYSNFIEELYSSDLIKNKAKQFIQLQLSEIQEITHQSYTSSFEFHLLAKGELISTNLFHLLLVEQNEKNTLLNALDFMRLNQHNAPDEEYLEEKLKMMLSVSQQKGIFITQGFICRNAFGELSNLGRGGSDYSASLIGAALNCHEIQIWTDIDGMHNNDPRVINNTQAIRELSFDEAAELAYFGAKILHPTSIKPAKRKNIPVRLLNTLEPTAEGTFISYKTARAKVKAVAAKSGITAIKIRSSEMLQAPGFLRRIFEVFELYKTSIDMITTSEVAVSVTIDDEENLNEIVNTLKEFAHVEIDQQLAIICVVGEYLVENSSVVQQVIQSLKGLSIRMISYGGSAHNISILVSEDTKIKALKSLHRGLFNV